jgi:pimeloyl-ACP methyl ester carboxylesterase
MDFIKQGAVRANGIDFAYLEAGSGPLVLCLHGFPDTPWSFGPLLKELAADGYRGVAPFMRGYPPSGLAPDGDYRVMTLGGDALSLIEALGAKKAILVGHDWGAAAVYIAAALRPERIDGIFTAALPHLRRFLLWPNLRQLKRSSYMAFFQLRGTAERRIVSDDFKWLRELMRRWSPGWDFSDAEFAPIKAALSDPKRLSAELAYYRAMPRNIFSLKTGRQLFTNYIASADD